MTGEPNAWRLATVSFNAAVCPLDVPTYLNTTQRELASLIKLRCMPSGLQVDGQTVEAVVILVSLMHEEVREASEGGGSGVGHIPRTAMMALPANEPDVPPPAELWNSDTGHRVVKTSALAAVVRLHIQSIMAMPKVLLKAFTGTP
jgi:hypothetical protein